MNSFLSPQSPLHSQQPNNKTRLGNAILKWLLLCILLAGAAGGFWFYGNQNHKSPTQYVTAKAIRGNIVLSVNATGNLQPVKTITVGSQISGPISKIYVDYNDTVTKNQLLAEIDPSLLVSQIEQSEAQLSNSKSAMELAQRNAERSDKLFQSEYIARADWEVAQQNAKSARGSYQIAKSQVDRDRKNLEYAAIRSPVDGVVISRSVDEGQTVQASFQAPELFKIAEDLTHMRIDLNLSESDISQIKEGQVVRFTVDAYPMDNFEGIVQKIRLNPNNTQGVVTYQAVVAVENPQRKLIPGMTAYVKIVITEKDNVLTVPGAAFRYQPASLAKDAAPEDISKRTIYILRNGIPQPVKVSSGLADARRMEVITDTLKEGDPVILREIHPDEDE